MPRSSNPSNTRCSRCGKKFRDAAKMGSHVRRAHPKPGQLPERERERERQQQPAPFPAFVMTTEPHRITQPTTRRAE